MATRKYARRMLSGKPQEGAITTKEGNKFIYLQGRWYRPSEIPSELKGSETVKSALGRLAAKPAPAKPATSKSTASKPAASRPAPKPASKPAPAKPAPAKTTASKPTSAPTSDKKRKSIAETLKQLRKMKRESKKRQGKEPKMQGVGPYRSANKYEAAKAGQPAKPAQAAKPNTKSKLRQAMEERMKKRRGRGY
jgi:type IV secretory pathway VirB10-like protein